MTFNFNVKGITPKDIEQEASSGAVSPQIIESISPETLHGLCFWLDGRCNTRAGKDHTKTYLENLVWNVPQTASIGNNEYLQNGRGNSWDGDFLALGNYAYYPYCCYPTMTIEAVVKFSGFLGELAINNMSYNGQWVFSVYDNPRNLGFITFDKTGGLAGASTLYNFETGKPYYLVATMNQTSICSRIVNLNLKTESAFNGPVKVNSTTVQMGMGTGCNNSNSEKGQRWSGLKIGMNRIWNRVLSDEEINRNYQDLKVAFGIEGV